MEFVFQERNGVVSRRRDMIALKLFGGMSSGKKTSDQERRLVRPGKLTDRLQLQVEMTPGVIKGIREADDVRFLRLDERCERFERSICSEVIY